jgi:hypothetical protein
VADGLLATVNARLDHYKGLISRLCSVTNVETWLSLINRGLMRIFTVTRLEVGCSARTVDSRPALRCYRRTCWPHRGAGCGDEPHRVDPAVAISEVPIAMG